MSFVPDAGTRITVDMTKVSGTQAKAHWYDPIAGAATLIGTYSTGAPLDFTSPADSLVLVLDDASKTLPPPASSDATGGPRSGKRIPLPRTRARVVRTR